MCVNWGNLDLLMNFLRSACDKKIDIRNLIVFAADPKVEKALKAIGVLVFSHDALGSFTAGAARSYGDHTFVEMMWCAAASRGLPAALRHRRDSPPSDEAVGGLTFDFERISGEIATRYITHRSPRASRSAASSRRRRLTRSRKGLLEDVDYQK